MDTHTPPEQKKRTSAKTIWREPTADDPRRRIIRTPEEMREIIITFRITKREMNELYRYARARSATMSYMIRQAMTQTYPDIFHDTNRYIRKPRKPKTIQEKTTTQTSYSTGTITVLDRDAGTEDK